MSSLVCAGAVSVAGKITRSALETRSSRPPASTKTSPERAMADEDNQRPHDTPSGYTHRHGRRPRRHLVRAEGLVPDGLGGLVGARARLRDLRDRAGVGPA